MISYQITVIWRCCRAVSNSDPKVDLARAGLYISSQYSCSVVGAEVCQTVQVLDVDGVTGGFNFQVWTLPQEEDTIILWVDSRILLGNLCKRAYAQIKICLHFDVSSMVWSRDCPTLDAQNAWTGGYIAGTTVAEQIGCAQALRSWYSCKLCTCEDFPFVGRWCLKKFSNKF